MRRTVMVVALALVGASCGGTDSYEDAVNAQTDIMTEMLEILEGVDDEEIERFNRVMDRLLEKAQKL